MFKNVFLFYVTIGVPLLLLVLLADVHQISPFYFCMFLLLYALVYHPLICGLRLYNSGKIRLEDIKLNFIPFWNRKYFLFLFFNKNKK
jgi:hypothetical protein